MTKKMAVVCPLAALGLFISMPGAVRAADLITNGGFETTTGGTTGYIGKNGFGLTGWTNTNYNESTLGYNFIYNPNTASTTGASGIKLWGPGGGPSDTSTYSDNGLGASPDGGNFLAADGAYETAAITQTVNGLTSGATYFLNFDYAGAQQSGYSGATTEGWKVTFGSDTQETPILSNASHGFTGWQNDTMAFVASSSSELLSFLAVGTPSGEPPFALLDGVSLDTPEPSAFVAMFAGVIGLGVFARRRSRTRKSVK